MMGLRLARVRLVLSVLGSLVEIPHPDEEVRARAPRHMTYVEWHTKLTGRDLNTGFFKVIYVPSS